MEQNPFNQFNPLLFLNGSASQFNNPFNPFQGTSSSNNPWMQGFNQSPSTNNIFDEWQKLASSSLNAMSITGADGQNKAFGGFNPALFATNQTMNSTALPWVNLSQQWFAKLQDWQKDMQQVVAMQWQQNLLNAMLDASKQNANQFSEQMGNLLADWQKNDLAKLFTNPLLAQLQEVIAKGDIEAQKKILSQLSNQWLGYAKNLQRLDIVSYSEKTWLIRGYKKIVDETLATYEKMQSKHFDNVDQANFKNYLSELSSLFDGFVNLVENFNNFEHTLDDSFTNAALSQEMDLKDVGDLFNLWCTKFDECYNKQVLTDKYQHSFSQWVNAISKFKIAVQNIMDRMVEQAGLPSNREMNTVHRRLAQNLKDNVKLQKQVAELSSRIESLGKAKTAQVATQKVAPKASRAIKKTTSKK